MVTSNATHQSGTAQDQDAGADLGATAAEAGQQVQQQVVNLGEQVRQQATDQVLAQKDRAVDALETVALLLHQAGEHAQTQDKAAIAQYVDKAADQVETWSTTLREQDVTQLLETTQQFARRQPLAFLGGALAVGFAGVRFFRSTAPQAESTEQPATPEETGTGGMSQDMSQAGSDDIDRAADLSIGDRPLDVGLSLPEDWDSDLDGNREEFTEETVVKDLPGEAAVDDAHGLSDTESR